MALTNPPLSLYDEWEMSIRVFIIDEHKLVRESLTRRLAALPGMDVVGNTGNGEEGLRLIKELRPDVVLLDTKMKKADGMDVCKRACSSNGAVKVAILTSYTDPEERRMAYQAGVRGYLLKDIDMPKLVQWIRRLARNNGDKRSSRETKVEDATATA